MILIINTFYFAIPKNPKSLILGETNKREKDGETNQQTTQQTTQQKRKGR